MVAPSLDNLDSSETKQRLVEAAGEIFAEHGLHSARVRDICQRANANIAAINYHFGDKESLYRTVLHYAYGCLIRKYPLNADLPPNPTAEQRLMGVIRSYLRRVLDQDKPCWHGKLVTREILEPTGAIDDLVKDSIRPQAEVLVSIVTELGEGTLTPEQVRLCSESIIGQCLIYRHARSVLLRLDPQVQYDQRNLERMAAHITRFSLAGIRDAVAQQKEQLHPSQNL